MKKETNLYQLQVVWNREFDYVNYSTPDPDIKVVKAKGEVMLNSGDEAAVKKYRILNSKGDVVYPVYTKTKSEGKTAYKIWYDEPYYIHKDSNPDNLIWTTYIKYAMRFNNYVSELTELGMYNSLFVRYYKLHLN
jgi:hypothetical protein